MKAIKHLTVVLVLGIGCVFLGMLVTLKFSIPVLFLAFICPEHEAESKQVGFISIVSIVSVVFLLSQGKVSKHVGLVHIFTAAFLWSQGKATKQVSFIHIVNAVFLCLEEESKQLGLIPTVTTVFPQP